RAGSRPMTQSTATKRSPTMTDERLVQRLEEQLRDAHATNAGLRERVEEADRAVASANRKAAIGEIHSRQLEGAHAKQRAAEDNAAAAQRKRDDAERALLRAHGEAEELRAQLNRQQAELDVLHALSDKIAAARSVHDLISLAK